MPGALEKTWGGPRHGTEVSGSQTQKKLVCHALEFGFPSVGSH